MRQDVTHLVLWIVLGAVAYFLLRWLELPVSFVWRAFVAVNIATLLLYGFDKLTAKNNARRVSERVLYITAFLFGSPGALVGMYVFRHKTRKTSFQFVLAIVILIQILIVLAVQQFLL